MKKKMFETYFTKNMKHNSTKKCKIIILENKKDGTKHNCHGGSWVLRKRREIIT